MQGGVSQDTLSMVAIHCRHWRDIFPDAEIILSISTPDVIRGTHADGSTDDLTLAGPVRDRNLAKIALALIKTSCDKVVQAQGALPLPPIKTDSPGPNNGNLQISAAQAGLAAATGTHILRTRADLIFADDSFIGQWIDGNGLQRGDHQLLRKRVLISYLYTLNPYTFERMPYHYSDWFHFGLAEDVRALWDVPFVTLADATFYKTHPYAEYSNHQERLVLTKRAVEQHITFNALVKLNSEVSLDYHNDLSQRKKSIDVLCDNFIVCDLIKAKCIFDKYAMDFENPAKRLHCIPPEDWRTLTLSAPAEREAFLLEKGRIAREPVLAPFPRHYPGIALRTKIGRVERGTIIAHGKSGILVHGPYDILPRGSYTAIVEIIRIEGHGLINIHLTLEEGARKLASRQVFVKDCEGCNIEIDFDVQVESGKQFEVVVDVPAFQFAEIKDVTVVKREERAAPKSSMLLSPAMPPLKTIVGQKCELGLATSGRAGHLLFGPYIALDAGRYILRVNLPKVVSSGKAYLEVVGSKNRRCAPKYFITRQDCQNGFFEVPFLLKAMTEAVEFRIQADASADFVIGAIELRQY